MLNTNDPLVKALLAFGVSLTGLTEQQIVAEVEARKAAARRRVEAQNRAYNAAVARMDVQQLAKVDAMVSQGYRVTRMAEWRDTPQVAALLQKDAVWNSAKGRIGIKLAVVYPEGRTSETFERTISLKHP